ncbi:hypothetical protein OG292_14405 [Streptomyces sp. NBC_01511]|uniref:hypothetical protein n=1 Tax=unclassified Streptomyces TaxID=2593676 RepID=UPI00386C77DE
MSEAEYACVEPKTLVWKLAEMVNLQQSPAGRDAAVSVVETTIGTVEAGLSVLEREGPVRSAADEREVIRQGLETGGGLAEPVLSLVAELISELRSSWRLTSAWKAHPEDRGGAQTRSFAVWDCGPLGYWLRELPSEPVPEERISPASAFRLVRVDAKTIWARIADLLPDQDELRHAAARWPDPDQG